MTKLILALMLASTCDPDPTPVSQHDAAAEIAEVWCRQVQTACDRNIAECYPATYNKTFNRLVDDLTRGTVDACLDEIQSSECSGNSIPWGPACFSIFEY